MTAKTTTSMNNHAVDLLASGTHTEFVEGMKGLKNAIAAIFDDCVVNANADSSWQSANDDSLCMMSIHPSAPIVLVSSTSTATVTTRHAYYITWNMDDHHTGHLDGEAYLAQSVVLLFNLALGLQIRGIVDTDTRDRRTMERSASVYQHCLELLERCQPGPRSCLAPTVVHTLLTACYKHLWEVYTHLQNAAGLAHIHDLLLILHVTQCCDGCNDKVSLCFLWHAGAA